LVRTHVDIVEADEQTQTIPVKPVTVEVVPPIEEKPAAAVIINQPLTSGDGRPVSGNIASPGNPTLVTPSEPLSAPDGRPVCGNVIGRGAVVKPPNCKPKPTGAKP
jgi:hypothetical protein